MEIKTVEFHANGAGVFFRAELLWRELGRNMAYLKCETAYGSDENVKNWLCLGAAATRNVVKLTIFENVFRIVATGNF